MLFSSFLIVYFKPEKKMIMLRTSLIFLVLLFTITSCEKESIFPTHVEDGFKKKKTSCIPQEPEDRIPEDNCSTELCNQYFPIWKELFQEKNNLNEDFMDTHITIHKTSTTNWKKGISFRVCYEVKFDWARAYNCDSFIINITADDKYYPLLDLPRETDLTKDKIRIAIENRAFSSELTRLDNTGEIAYSTQEAAMKDLIDASEVTTLCVRQIKVDYKSGHLILSAYAQYEGEENSCILGKLDLITKTKDISDMPCFISTIK